MIIYNPVIAKSSNKYAKKGKSAIKKRISKQILSRF
jgi:hypothetical protein